MSADVWPSHEYIPGLTQRHPEDAFDTVRQTALAGMTPQMLAASDAFRLGRQYIAAGFNWEAHEVLEPVWMALPNPSEPRQFVQALIQIANGFLKLKMGRPKAARRLEEISRALLRDVTGPLVMGVAVRDALDLLDELRRQTDVVI